MTDVTQPILDDDGNDISSEIDRDLSAEFDDMFGDYDHQEPQEPKEQWVFDSHHNDELYKTAEYKMACFIMGTLIHEEVVTTADHSDLGCSDMAYGIRIIAKCLQGNLLNSFTELPFDL